MMAVVIDVYHIELGWAFGDVLNGGVMGQVVEECVDNGYMQ